MSNLLPAGKYRARAMLTDTEHGATYAQFGAASTGTKQVLVNFQIAKGNYEGVSLAWRGYFTEKTAERTIKSLRCCGFKGDDLSTLPTQVLNQEVEIVVDHEVSTQNGNTYPKIQWVNPVGGMGMKVSSPMGNDDLKRFAAEMKQLTSKVSEVDGPKPGDEPNDAHEAPDAPPINNDDDIPF